MTTFLFIYVALSLVIGGTVMTVEIWSPRSRIRLDDGGAPILMAIVMGLVATLIWPVLAVSLVRDTRKGLVMIDHCDDYIDDPAADPALRKFLAFARGPAHGLLTPKPHPTLYADYKKKRVRVTMASRLGDVGITSRFEAETGYEDRVRVSKLKNFSETP
jgi:hypothetical protein